MATYLLIADTHRKALIHELTRLLDITTFNVQPLKSLIASVSHAPTITLPEVHQFRDAHGQRLEIAGWNQADAQQRALQERGYTPPLSWESSCVHYPGCSSVRLPDDSNTPIAHSKRGL